MTEAAVYQQGAKIFDILMVIIVDIIFIFILLSNFAIGQCCILHFNLGYT
jgi:hypothetical protein